MIWKRTFRNFRQADTANRQSSPPNDVIKRMKARAAWRRKESELLGHFAVWDPKKKLAAEKQQETHILSNEEQEKSIEDYVERNTGGARKRVEDGEAAVQHKQEGMKHAELVGLTTREPERTFDEMIVAIGDSLSDLESCDDREDAEDKDDEETVQGKLSEDDKPGWVMGTITKTVQQRLERFLQKQMTLDKSTQPGWEDAATFFRERDKKYGTLELSVPAVIQP